MVPIPWLVAMALQQDGWYLRMDCIWSKPNPMPESVTDRPTKAHEYIFLLSKQPRYFFDAEAVKEDNASPEQLAHNLRYAKPYQAYDDRAGETGQPGNVNNVGIHSRPGSAGRNIRSVWTIATHPFAEAHFATFTPALAERCIKASTSEKGCCAACGAPWVRVMSDGEKVQTGNGRGPNAAVNPNRHPGEEGAAAFYVLQRETTGWAASCCCEPEAVTPCVVLDPFAGAGTVSLVAERLGRDSIGVELNPEYVRMAEARIRRDCPMFAAVEVV
jgi:hypothetical protein